MHAIFDLDGIITRTATVHGRAWKRMFDNFLRERADRLGESFREFTHQDDYLPFVDGKPRYEGVRSFLESRDISLPYGDPGDAAEMETVCGLGNRKNDFFNQVLEEEGVEVYESTVDLIRSMHAAGVRTAVASSSKNCAQVLERAGLSHLFEARVDGVVSAEIGLKGKPEPDIFIEACRRIDGTPYHSVVFEDAVSGVAAGKAGGFGLVVGVAREDNREELLAAGADIVVDDLVEITMDRLVSWFDRELPERLWQLRYHGLDPSKEASREALLTTGNGYFGTRGCMEEMSAQAPHYPGTYIAGLYNRLTSRVGDRDVENEDFVNAPNWLPLSFAIGDGPWFDTSTWTLLSLERTLDLRNGILSRRMKVSDPQGFIAELIVERFAGMDDPHSAAIKYCIMLPEGGKNVNLRSAIDAGVINEGVARYRSLASHHLQTIEASSDGRTSRLLARTSQSGTIIAMAARHRILREEEQLQPQIRNVGTRDKAELEFSCEMNSGQWLCIEKVVSIFSGTEDDDPWRQALEHNARLQGYAEVRQRHTAAWKAIWDEADVQVEGDRQAQFLLRLHTYHMLSSASMHNERLDAGITARGLHGEAYRGHIFWDEIFILPFFTLRFPSISRALLMYRYRRLDMARSLAAKEGLPGAMFPWQSGSDGREETQVVHLNPVSGKWGDDYSSLQRHVSLAIAYNVWDYYHTSGDKEFLMHQGAEMFLEVCRFWAAKASLDEGTGRWSIKGVMGPDEFHEKLPGSETGGLSDNAYTNIMTAWMLRKASDIWALLDPETRGILQEKINIRDTEIEGWSSIASALKLVISPEGILAQFDGYFHLKELDWDDYRRRYKNIYRMDRLLKADGKSPDEYKVAKQADTLMTFYNLRPDQVVELIRDMGYDLPVDFLQKNLEYYLARTSHGSTLSRVVHAYLARLAGQDALAWDLYMDALGSDYNDIQGGTTGEGIHAGVMASTVLLALTTYAGLDFRDEIPSLDPSLPEDWTAMAFRIKIRNAHWQLKIDKQSLSVKLLSGPAGSTFRVLGTVYPFDPGSEKTIQF